MTFNIPYGGFYAALTDPKTAEKMRYNLEASDAKVITFDNHGIVMASWNQFQGQGAWNCDSGAVCYDLELSNETALRALVQEDTDISIDLGELIWKLYKKFGRQIFDRFRGAFALALWDNMENQLIVITDCYGIRPVVYTKSPSCIAAASRIRHLVSAGINPGILRSDAVFHYIFFQAICTPLTIYENIDKLSPGKGLVIDKMGVTAFTHYDINYNENFSKTETEWCREIFNEVEKAVEAYARDLPLDRTGCFLSGGTDSSSIVGLYTKFTGKPVKTFSIGFDDPKYNEMDFAQTAANVFNTDQHAYFVTPDDVLYLIEILPEIYDEPFGNASVVPAFFCANLAAQSGVSYLLGGDGGDEIFGGNERYVTNLVFEKYLKLPGMLRCNMIEPLLAIMPDRGILHKAKRYVRRANIRNPERFYSYNLLAETGLEQIFRKDFLETLDPESFIDIARRHYKATGSTHYTNRLMYLDMKFTITDNDIRKVTQMVESVGLKVRSPLLHRDLVDFSTTIPAELKVKWGKNRYIFKQAMKGFLPDEIISKSKHGMGLPVTPWFKKDKHMNTFLYDNLFSGAPALQKYIHPDFIHKMKAAFETDETSYYGDNLWVFLILEMWLKKSCPDDRY